MKAKNTKPGFEHTWRWFGPNDRITLSDIRQTGATGIVTALHQIPVGDVWPEAAIAERKKYMESHDLSWSVVESVPVSEAIKTQTDGWKQHIENYQQTLRNLAKQGIKTVCYNFMPILDWSRTELKYQYANGTESLKYDYHWFAAFDLFLLKRKAAPTTYPSTVISHATAYFSSLTTEEKQELQNTILLGLPGSLEAYSLEAFAEALNTYASIDKTKLREHLVDFLKAVVPVAEQVGIKMAIHPDDPPWPLLGLPRIVSTYDDLKFIIEAVDSPANGITLCTGSLGAGYDNDLVKMSKDFASNIHFVHLRNVMRDAAKNFQEQNLFEGDADMVRVIQNLILESRRRMHQGMEEFKIPMRPDHGFQMLEDIGQENYPGYGLYGRMKSLAEIRGLEIGILSQL